MKPEERSEGITAAAVVVFLGSAFAALRGLVLVQICMGLRVLLLPTELTSFPQARTVLIVMAILCLAVAVWGSATGFGLLKLKAWARISVLVFSVLALLWSSLNILAVYSVERLLSAPVPHAATTYIIFKNAAVPGLIAVWWLVYFNRKAVRCRFEKSTTRGAIC